MRPWDSLCGLKFSEGSREVIGAGGGGEREPNQILSQEPTYIPNSKCQSNFLQEGDENTNQQDGNHPNEVTKPTEEE
jgi:hypothetical protein